MVSELFDASVWEPVSEFTCFRYHTTTHAEVGPSASPSIDPKSAMLSGRKQLMSSIAHSITPE